MPGCFFLVLLKHNFFAQRDISIDMGVDDVDENAFGSHLQKRSVSRAGISRSFGEFDVNI